MRAPGLFMQNNVGQILQHPVRGDGKNAGRLFLRTRHLHAQQLGIKPYVKNHKFSSPTTIALICGCDLYRVI
jgi:hypothetical protein